MLTSSSFSSSESFNSNDDFPSSYSLDVFNNNEILFSPSEHTETLDRESVSSTFSFGFSWLFVTNMSSKPIKRLSLDWESVSPTLSLDSSSNMPSKPSKRFTKKMKCTSPADDKVEESFLKLTSVVSLHLENKTEDDDEIFAKAVACRLKKILELEKTKVKGQIMKILCNLWTKEYII